jgi:glycerol-3-phosphate dehydrogenase
VLFAVPWHDQVVVGTTDTPVAHASLEPRALDEERDFVMSHAQKYLAQGPTESDVLSIYVGQRPLVKAGDGHDTAALSRDHTIVVSPSGLITVTGGEWTTYRRMAEDVIGRAELVGGLGPVPCRTQELAIRGGNDPGLIDQLIAEHPGWEQKLHPALPYRRGEVVWQVRHEMARTVEDVLSRRMRALILNAQASIAAAPVVAELMAHELGYDPAWQAAQVTAYTALARGYVYNDPASRQVSAPIQ